MFFLFPKLEMDLYRIHALCLVHSQRFSSIWFYLLNKYVQSYDIMLKIVNKYMDTYKSSLNIFYRSSALIKVTQP